MREPGPDYASRQYDRPNQPWVCGLSCEGRACPAGPTARGACPALAECVPARDGDRWKCNRSTLRGGECAEGPTPEGGCGCVHRCRPVRSLRSLRGRFVVACTLLAAGSLVILLNTDWRDEAISPGPLTSAHAQLTESLSGNANCAACHAAADRSVVGWTLSLAGLHGEASHQSARCMECHDASISKAFALAAHSVSPASLRRITAEGIQSVLESEVACATCHREHQGARFDIAAMDDAACQSCHQARYASFSTDHPDFGNWPYERRTRIAFNHASHRGKHFAEKSRAFDCQACHIEDATNNVQLLASYEQACASCHDEKIATSVAKGVPMFALPTLDVDALKAAGHDIEAWPEDATGDFDGRLPPAMKLLLAADPAARDAMELLGADFDFMDVDPDDPLQLAAAEQVTTSIKSLFSDLSRRGPTAVHERLASSLGLETRDSVAPELLAGLPAEVLHGAAKWLGVNVDDEGLLADKAATARESVVPLHFDPPGAWSFDATSLMVRYQPANHADPVLASWLELLAAVPQLESRPVALAMFRELSKATAAGTCTSCHSVENGDDGRLAVNWRASNRGNEGRTLTKFSHGPHLLIPQLADCTSCHAINDVADTSKSYANHDPHGCVSDFAPMSKQQCAQCHTARAAGESCQKCHNYHVEVVEQWRKGSRRGAEVAELRNANRR